MMLSVLFCIIDVCFSSSLSDWDFTGLAADPYYEFSRGSNNLFRFNFRKTIAPNATYSCSLTDCVVEQLGDGFCNCYGNLSTENVSIASDDSMINFTYVSNSSSNPTQSLFSLTCANVFSYNYSYSSYKELNFTIEAPQGCKREIVVKKKSPLTFGGVFLIILLSVIVLYFVVSTIVQVALYRQVGVKTMPLYPIILFFALVATGVKTIFSMVTNAGKQSEYATVK